MIFMLVLMVCTKRMAVFRNGCGLGGIRVHIFIRTIYMLSVTIAQLVTCYEQTLNCFSSFFKICFRASGIEVRVCVYFWRGLWPVDRSGTIQTPG